MKHGRQRGRGSAPVVPVDGAQVARFLAAGGHGPAIAMARVEHLSPACHRHPPMKPLPACLSRRLIVTLALAGACLLSHESAQAQPAPHAADASVQWRRTVNGWERADLWETGTSTSSSTVNGPTAPLPVPHAHPVFVAALMLTAAGLLAIGAGDSRCR